MAARQTRSLLLLEGGADTENLELIAHQRALAVMRQQRNELQGRLNAATKAPNGYGNGNSAVRVTKTFPNPLVVRDGLLAPLQKTLVQRLKKWYQGLQTQTLRVMRASDFKADQLPGEMPNPFGDIYWDEATADNAANEILSAGITESGALAFRAASESFSVPVTWDVSNPWLPRYIGLRADLIRGIDENLKAELIRQLEEGYRGGEGIPELSQRVSGVFRNAIDWQSERIARTETMQSYAHASLEAYRQGGIERVQMYDGPHDDSAACEAVNGMIVSLAEATTLMAAEHPNGVRAVAPYVELPSSMQTPQMQADPTVGVMKVVEVAFGMIAKMQDQSVSWQQTQHEQVLAMIQQLAARPVDQEAEKQKQEERADALSLQKSQHEMTLALQRAQQEQLMALVKQLADRPMPEFAIDLPPPPPITLSIAEGAIRVENPINVHEGAFRGMATLADGAIKVDAPVTFAEKAFEGMAKIEEGAIKIDTPININEGAFTSSNPVTIEEGAVKVDSPVNFAKGALQHETPITLNMPPPADVIVKYEGEPDDEG